MEKKISVTSVQKNTKRLDSKKKVTDIQLHFCYQDREEGLKQKCGDGFRKWRESQNMSQGDIANILGLSSNNTVGKWERGESNISVSQIMALSELFGCSIDCILGGEKTIVNMKILDCLEGLNADQLEGILAIINSVLKFWGKTPNSGQ